MITEWILSIQLDPAKHLPENRAGFIGEKLHALLLRIVSMESREASSYMHDGRGHRPFSIGLFKSAEGQKQDPATIVCRCTVFESELSQVVENAFKRASSADLVLGNQHVRDISVSTKCQTTFQDLLNNARPVSQAAVHFLSPTSFRSSGKQKLLPVPGDVFESLRIRWNRLAPEQIPPVSADSLDSIMISHLDLSSRICSFKSYRILGIVGVVAYRFPAGIPAEERKVLDALLSFANLGGVGYKTTMGLGHVSVRDRRYYTRRKRND